MKNFTIAFLFIAGMLFSFNSMAQWQSVLAENCDAAVPPVLPTGFTSIPADTTGWVTSSTNPGTGYANASGLNNFDLTNNSSVAGTKYLFFPSFSTSGFDSVSLSWGARLTKNFLSSGSVITGPQYSIDGGTNWTTLSYTENTNDSNWYLDNGGKPVYLPADALNQANVMLRFTISIVPNPSGTYRIDDVSINGHKGTLSTSSLSLKDVDVRSFYDASSKQLIITPTNNKNYDITVCNLLGQSVYSVKNIGSQTAINLSKQADGVYFLSVVERNSGVKSTIKFNKF